MVGAAEGDRVRAARAFYARRFFRIAVPAWATLVAIAIAASISGGLVTREDLVSERENRCIVPATSFCEYEDTKPRKTPTWFALNDDRPLFAFRRALDPLDRCPRAREARPSWGEHQLFGFLTTTANAIGALIRPKATPVILKTPDGVDVWLSAETKDALELQRPLPDGALKIVARGERSDGKDLALDVADSGSAS